MSKWTIVKLGEVATYINGYAFKPSDWSDVGLPIIRIQDLTGNNYETNFYSGEYDPKYEINDGDILISWSASLGIKKWNSGKSVLNQNIFKVVFDKLQIDKNYYFYAVEYLLDDMTKETHGSTMKHITKPRFDNTFFPYPPIQIQRRIAETLDKVNLLISICRDMLIKCDTLVKSQFVEMFGDPGTNPKGWNETTIGKECYYIKDGPHKSLQDIGKENGGHPFISVRNIINGYIDFSTAKYISDDDYFDAIKKCNPEKGDMLYSKGGTTGIAKLVDIDEQFANWVHVAVLKFDKLKINGIFFENMLNLDYCYQQSQRLTKGIANRDLVLSSIAQIQIYNPPLDLQNQFADFVKTIDKSKLAVKKTLEKAETLKKALMQEYFG